jgi:hypothetical protein
MNPHINLICLKCGSIRLGRYDCKRNNKKRLLQPQNSSRLGNALMYSEFAKNAVELNEINGRENVANEAES